jgi:hypothetical protein
MATRTGMSAEAAVRGNFIGQAEACRSLGSPFTALFCEMMAARLDRESAFGERVLGWRGDPRSDALALRAAGAFNALARSGHAPALQALYPPAKVDSELLWSGLVAALRQHDAFLTAYLDSAPQTNEVKRCAVLLGGALIIAQETGLPLDLLEIGASAGLNLGFDGYRYELSGEFGGMNWGAATAPVIVRSEWRGSALPPLGAPLAITTRRACDLNPLDPANPADRSRVMSYIWPDQADRLAATAAAFDAAAARPWRVERTDAADWVERQLSQNVPDGRARVLMHTIMWQYLPGATQERIVAAIARAGAAATIKRPLAWLRMEADMEKASAAVTLTLWPDGQERQIARADFHGRWVEWR